MPSTKTDSLFVFSDRSFPSICWRNQLDGTVMLRSGSVSNRRYVLKNMREFRELFL